MLLFPRWEALPEQTRQDVLRILSQIVGRQVAPVPGHAGVAHDND